MNDYVVIYFEDGQNADEDPYPFLFLCQADDISHAEEQCLNANLDCTIDMVHYGDNCAEAISKHWNNKYKNRRYR